MPQARKEVIAWVGSHVLPHEAAVRQWLRRMISRASDVDDIVQEAYCRIAAHESIDHIISGRAYFFRTARNVALEQIRRARIVRIDSISDGELLSLVDESPPPDRVVAGARQLQLVQSLIEALPEKCRDVFVLRRVYGISQKEIAARLGISESTVEMHTARGLRAILKSLEQGTTGIRDDVNGAENERTRHRTRD